MRKTGLFLILVVMLLTGCRSEKGKFTAEQLEQIPLVDRSNLPEASGGFVLSVAGETVTAEKMIDPFVEPLAEYAASVDYATFAKRVRPQLEQYIANEIANILLYQKAKIKAGEQIEDALENAVESEVRQFVTGFGGDYAKAEASLKEMDMDWQSYREYKKKQIMIQSYIGAELSDDQPITYSELMTAYEELKTQIEAEPFTVRFQLIDVEIAKAGITDPNKSREENARELAGQLIEKINAGEDFAQLAKDHSTGPWAALGGLWNPVKPESLAEPYDVLAAEAEKMKVGDMTGPIEANGHIFIMKLIERNLPEVPELAEVQDKLETKIDFERRKKAIDDISAKLVKQAAVSRKDEFVSFCIQTLYLRCRG